MTQKSLVTQTNGAVVPTGKSSDTTVTRQDKNNTDITVQALVVNLKLTNEDYKDLISKVQVPQQPPNITINNNKIIDNTQIVNNFNGSPSAAQNLGQQGGSQDKLLPGSQTPLSASRAIADKAHVVDNVPPAQNPKQKIQEKSQNGSGDKVNNSRPTKVQTRSIPDRSRAETGSAHVAKPATGQVASRPAQDGSKKPESAIVLAVQVPGQAHREVSQPQGSQIREASNKIRHPDPPGENGFHRKKTAPTSATTSPSRGNDRNRPSGSREDSAVTQSQGQTKSQTALHQSQAPSEPRGRTAPEQPAVTSQHLKSQPAKREEPSGVAHGHSAVTRSKDHGTGAVPEAPKELSKDDIREFFNDLNSELEKSKTRTSSGPARVILLGKAYVKFMGLKTTENTEKVYHIDVMLDGGERGRRVRQCMVKEFREFDEQDQNATKACRTFFGTSSHRADVFRDVTRECKCVFEKDHLKVYVMNHDRAVEFELRRWADAGNDKRIEDTSLDIAVAIIWARKKRGLKIRSRSNFEGMRYIKKEGIRNGAINALEKRFDPDNNQAMYC